MTPLAVPITLGDFTLERPLGRGGMAEVWLGRHRMLGRPAALKVMRPALADDAAFIEGFHREVQAVAGLDHPGVVGVFDTGLVDAGAAAASGGAFAAGSPWLAMEYAAGGDLSSWVTPVSWGRLHATMLEILDALAHAHARGVIHRDLKPANILVRGPEAARALVLTDFGIAHVVEPSLDSDAVGATTLGTPQYMSPEQIRGHWRDYGPWTDLYALGCLAFELACGHTPYRGSSPVGVAIKQVSAPVPALGETRGVPAAFGAWVRRLLAKKPEERFECAADAAWHLARIPAPGGVIRGSGSFVAVVASRPTVPMTALGTLAVVVDTALLTQAGGRREEDSTVPPGAGDEHETPPMPASWRLPDAFEAPRALGTGLFAVRETPFVGREAERDRLWAALGRVRARGTVGVVGVEGGSGSGKSRLVDWLARRAEEVGAAIAIRVDHGPVPSPLDGVLAAMRSWFRGDELARPALDVRIDERLRRLMPFMADADVARMAGALATLLDPAPAGAGRSAHPGEQRAAVAQWLRQVTERRPVVLHIEDAHFAVESLALAEHLVADARQAPILVVVTLCRDRLAERPEALEIIERLAARAEVDRWALGPLSLDDHGRFVASLLGLSPRLVEAVVAGTGGDPWFAEQVVADWVERDLLTPGAEGYEGAGVEVPADVLALVQARIERLAASFAEPERVIRALEAAAVLGHTVDRGEWMRVCARLSAPPPPGLVMAIVDRGFARLVPSGFAWAHDAWRAAMAASARRNGRWVALHGIAAKVLRTAPPSAVGNERIARHLHAAGRLDEARAALYAAARLRLENSDYRRAAGLAEEIERAAVEQGLSGPDRVRSLARAMRADALRYLSQIDEARAILAGLADDPHPAVQAEVARISAGMAHFADDIERSHELYERAIALYRGLDDVVGEIRSRHGWSWVQQTRGRHAESRAGYEAAAALAAAHGEDLEEAWCRHGLASVFVYEGRIGSREPAERALVIFERAGARGGEAAARMFIAEGLGCEGRFDEAWPMYRAAIDGWQALGSPFVPVGITCKALMQLDAGLDDAAGVSLARVADEGAKMPGQFRPLYRVARALLAARRGEADAFEPVRSLIAGAVVSPRVRHLLAELAERLAARPEEARAAWLLAARAFDSVEPEAAARCRARAVG